jgi:F-type H+-transporting ATPase subunit epsilon
MPIKVEIVSQERRLYEGEADMVTLPGVEGEMGILPHHTPLLTLLKIGVLRLKHGSEEVVFAIHGGLAEVQPDRVVVLADMAERSDEIDLARAQEARSRVSERLDATGPPDPDAVAALEMALQRAEVRIRAARKMRGRIESVSIRTEEE